MNITIELIERVKQEEPRAITELFDELFKTLIHTDITSFLKGTGEHVDVALITLQKVFANIAKHEFESLEKFISWVFTIHKHTAIDWVRKSEKRAHLRHNESQYPEPTVPAKDYERRDLFRLVYDFIQQHEDPKTGHILLLSSAGYSDDKIAGRLKIPLGTIKAKLRRARQRIRMFIESLEAITSEP